MKPKNSDPKFRTSSHLKTILLGSVFLAHAATAQVVTDFQGAFAPGNWTTTITPGSDGSVSVNAPTSVTLTSATNGTTGGPPSDVDYTIAAPSDGTVTFDWSYTTTDSMFDPFFLSGLVKLIESRHQSRTKSSNLSFAR